MKYQCLDLFSGLEGFSQAIQESPKWRVTTIDIEERFQPDIQADIMNLRPTDLLDRGVDPDLVLASPPCTCFSPVAWSHEIRVDTDGSPKTREAREAVTLVYHTLGLVHGLDPDYWFIENPKGALRWVIGLPEGTVDYCAYGHYTKKPTDLWGKHPLEFNYRKCPHNTHTDRNITDFEKGPKDPAERAKVPAELSQQIHDVVTDALNHTPPQQTTLTTAAPDGGDA